MISSNSSSVMGPLFPMWTTTVSPSSPASRWAVNICIASAACIPVAASVTVKPSMSSSNRSEAPSITESPMAVTGPSTDGGESAAEVPPPPASNDSGSDDFSSAFSEARFSSRLGSSGLFPPFGSSVASSLRLAENSASMGSLSR